MRGSRACPTSVCRSGRSSSRGETRDCYHPVEDRARESTPSCSPSCRAEAKSGKRTNKVEAGTDAAAGGPRCGPEQQKAIHFVLVIRLHEVFRRLSLHWATAQDDSSGVSEPIRHQADDILNRHRAGIVATCHVSRMLDSCRDDRAQGSGLALVEKQLVSRGTWNIGRDGRPQRGSVLHFVFGHLLWPRP